MLSKTSCTGNNLYKLRTSHVVFMKLKTCCIGCVIGITRLCCDEVNLSCKLVNQSEKVFLSIGSWDSEINWSLLIHAWYAATKTKSQLEVDLFGSGWSAIVNTLAYIMSNLCYILFSEHICKIWHTVLQFVFVTSISKYLLYDYYD